MVSVFLPLPHSNLDFALGTARHADGWAHPTCKRGYGEHNSTMIDVHVMSASI